MLLGRDLYVANFYLKQKQYRAALLRLQSLYQTARFDDLQMEVAYKLGLVHHKLDQSEEARRILEEVANNPKAGKYQKRAKRLLSKTN